jgi:hypothetical protein
MEENFLRVLETIFLSYVLQLILTITLKTEIMTATRIESFHYVTIEIKITKIQAKN